MPRNDRESGPPLDATVSITGTRRSLSGWSALVYYVDRKMRHANWKRNYYEGECGTCSPCIGAGNDGGLGAAVLVGQTRGIEA